jgi:catechol-2,3-dioxygenase
VRIRHLTLPTADLAALAAFYVDALGFRALVRQPTELTLAVGISTLTFRPAELGEAPFFHFAFQISADDVEAAAAWFGSVGPLLPFEEQEIIDFPNWQARSVYLRDPSGNIIECIGRRPLGLPATPEPFTAAAIHSLSEIGLVTDEVPALAAHLVTMLGLPYFSRQPADPRFTALGDDEGLLLLVPPGRAWFPTTTAVSAVYPVEVELEPVAGAAAQVLRVPLSA